MSSRRLVRVIAVPVVALAAVVLAFAACGGGWTGGVVTPEPRPVVSPEDAVAAVVAAEPRLAGIGPLDPSVIGQSAWVEVTPASGVGAFIVAVRVGWGDCPAGCISEHTWQYAVAPDGSVTLMAEAGEPVPPEAWPAPGGDGRTGLRLIATAGPVCPVESIPPDPACAPRPVAGAVVTIRDVDGAQVATATLDAAGSAFVEVPAGDYVVEAATVEGMMGLPAPLQVTVADGAATIVDLAYDTGIR